MTEDELIQRIKNAIILLSSFHPLKVGDLTLGSKNDSQLSVSGMCKESILQNMTRDSAIEQITEIKTHFYRMVKISSELEKFIENKDIEFSLFINAGMSDLEVCSEKRGILNWNIELNK